MIFSCLHDGLRQLAVSQDSGFILRETDDAHYMQYYLSADLHSNRGIVQQYTHFLAIEEETMETTLDDSVSVMYYKPKRTIIEDGSSGI